MNCIIIDDEMLSQEIMAQLIEGQTEMELAQKFPSCIAALKFLGDNEVDIIFLDLHMKDFSGIDFLKTMKQNQKVVLTTSDPSFASASYEYDNIIDYLVKPITPERFAKTVERINNAVALQESKTINYGGAKKEGQKGGELFINIDRRLIKIKYQDILFVEAKGDYINVRTVKEDFRVHSTLKKITEKLPESLFMQIHRSYVINFTKIIDIQDNSVLIEKSVIPISRSQRPNLMKRLNLLQ
ncbi:LytR/AlgR family response regulator transcription factor [Croceivirga sp. JEA036]|uniref:LytR/AlgR family response regulator transcription factor n=1 Tax=Croceivirga sp. JEA036 TaxID=2721162 RepID=UPI00143BFC8D|nr:LytTR family DNA-binding domain-containing protein [Croceivirga sp. JEA036]NJB36307.1 response regulator transcription factor [Croceivirga sp. JEA036]